MPRRFTRAVRVAEILGAVAAVVVLAILFVPRLSSGGNAATPNVEQPDLNVAVVPAVDSAGFFVAMHQGLFAAHGLHVTFVPAVSSATVINAQALAKPRNRIDISCGNYVSYIQAQENYDRGKRPSSASDPMVAANLDIFAEGSVMEPGAQGLYVMPGSRVRTLTNLEGRTIGVNAPGNILYLLAASALADHGLRVSGASGSARQVQDGVGVLGGPSQYADRLCRGQDDRVDLATAGLFLDLLHNGSTPSAPVPITSRRQCQGMSSAIESGVCPCASRNLLDAAFLRLRIFPRSMIRSWLYVTPSTRTEPNE